MIPNFTNFIYLQAGLYSAIPFIAEFVALIFFGLFSDWLHNNNVFTKTVTRKLMAGFGM